MNFKEWLLLTEKIMINDQEFRDPFFALQYIQKNHPNPENLVVTFTKIDKVGINPTSKHDTPLGIYLYPIDYVIENKMDVPFAGREPYINVCEFTRPEKILHMTPDVSNQKGMELLNVFPKEQVDKAVQYIADYYYINSNYSELWRVTKNLANDKPTQWNTNFRKCGIDGFVDHETGTICLEEPTQCVVFTTSALKLMHSIKNPIFEKITDKFGVDKYKIRKDKYKIEKMEEKQIIRMLQSRGTLNIGNLLQKATNKHKMAELIIKYKSVLSSTDLYSLIKLATDKQDKIAQLIIEKKPKLSSEHVKILLDKAIDKDKIAELIINKLPELTGNNVSDLLLFATKKDKIAELLGSYNISKITYDNVYDLLRFKNKQEKQKLVQIINQYHKNITPEIQELLA